MYYNQVGPKIGEGSFAVVHRGKEVHGLHRDVAIKIVRSQEELGLRDDDNESGVSYSDVLRSMRMEMEVMEVRSYSWAVFQEAHLRAPSGLIVLAIQHRPRRGGEG